MEIDTFSTRRRTLAKALSVLTGLAGLYVAAMVLPGFFRMDFSDFFVWFFLFVFPLPAMVFAGYLIYTAGSLWKEISFVTVRRFHFALSFTLCIFLLVTFDNLRTSVESLKTSTNIFGPEFLAFLLAGLFYWKGRKRVLSSFGIDERGFKEKAGRLKVYLAWLAFFFFGASLDLLMLLLGINDENFTSVTAWKRPVSLLIPLFAAVLFYKVTKYFIVTRPLQNTQSNLETES